MMDDNDIMRELMRDNPFAKIENQVYAGMLNMIADQTGMDEKGKIGLGIIVNVVNRHGIPTRLLMEMLMEIVKELEAMNNGE